MTRGLEATELLHPAPSARIDRGTTMYEDLRFSLVDQRVDGMRAAAVRERLLRLDAETAEPVATPSVRVRLGRGLIGLGGRIAGTQSESPRANRTVGRPA